MRIANWNVNSIRTRTDRVLNFLQHHKIDVLAVQETKCADDKFPYQAFEEAGYHVAHCGFHQWNGVALISRHELHDVRREFPGQPGFHKDPREPQNIEARAIGARIGDTDTEVWSLYVPNGREITDRHYEYKLFWLYALRDYVRGQLSEDADKKILLTGDFNIAPRNEDVWDLRVFDGATHVTEPERAAFQMLEEAGTREITRELTEARYTYWDYTSMRFAKGEGMRIDFQLASPQLAKQARSGFVDVDERHGKGASDHAPVVVDFQASDFDEVR